VDFVSYQDVLFFIKDKTDEALQIVLILVAAGCSFALFVSWQIGW